jgi:adenine-specific DNA-methyltransferase
MTSTNLTAATTDYIDTVPLTKRKELGQYMTPATVSDIIFDHVVLEDGMKILDPAVGTGELLLAVKRRLNGKTVQLHGWEIDPDIMAVAQQQLPEAEFKIASMLDGYPTEEHGSYDFIIGNPPYFELKNTDFTRADFTTAEGRTNIYGLFFERTIPLLKENGVLAFIVPPSMNAGSYFKKLRAYITQHTTVEYVEIVRENKKFADALTSVQIIVLRKTSAPQPSEFVHDFRATTRNVQAPVVFTDNDALIRQAWEGKKSVHEHGYEVTTGNIVWNENKEALSADQKPGSAPLYYAKDISADNTLQLSQKVADKRWLASQRPALTGKTILVNRIVGSLDNPRIKAALVDEASYYAENHVNVIRPRTNHQQDITIEELFQKLINIPDFTHYLKAVTGNTQLSAKEVEWLLPL